MNEKNRTSMRERFLYSEEGTIFITGCIMLIAWIAGVAILWKQGSAFWSKLLTMGFTHALAGRAASIAHGTSAGFHPAARVLLAIYFDVMFLFILYPLLVFSYKHFVERKFFKEHMQPVFDSARKNLTNFRKAKITGVFLFVWFPFWMTGIIAGSILGFLLGLRTWVNMLTVIMGSTSAVICWVYIADKLFSGLGAIHKSIPVTITVLLILFLAIMRLVKKRDNPQT